MADKPMNLWQKMAYVSKNVGAVKKDGYNKHNKYNYQSIEAITSALRVLMADTGLTMFSECVAAVLDNGNWHCEYLFTFVDTENGDSKECKWRASVPAKNDKAMGAAHSYAQKYFLMRTFMISSNEDIDLDSGGDNGAGEQQKKKKEKSDEGAYKTKLMELTFKSYDNQLHQINSLKKAFEEGEINLDMDVETAAKIINTRKALD
jgi:hypothetical protein